MNLLRASSTLLISVSLMTLAACGGEEAAGTAAPAAPAAANASAGVPAAAGTGGATGAGNDAALCRDAKKAHQDMLTQFATSASSATPSPEGVKKAVTDLGKALTALAATGGNSKVATAINQYGAAAAQAAAAADPGLAEDPALGKASEELRAACKAVGVDGF
jgi:hypothetical protein